MTALPAPRKSMTRPWIWALCIALGLLIGGGAAIVIGLDLAPAPVVALAVYAAVGAPLLWQLHRRRRLAR